MGKRVLAFDLGTVNLGAAAVEVGPNGWPRAVAAAYQTTAKGHDGRVTDDDARRSVVLFRFIAGAIAKLKPDLVAYEAYAVRDDAIGQKLRDFGQGMLDLFRWGGLESATAGIVAAASTPGFVPDLTAQLTHLAALLDGASSMRGRGAAAKVLVTQGLVIGAAEAAGVAHRPFLPSDIHRRFGFAEGRNAGGKGRRSSKAEVADGVRAVITNMDDIVAGAGISHANANHVHDAFAHALLGMEALMGQRWA